jgi:hypothetical protein
MWRFQSLGGRFPALWGVSDIQRLKGAVEAESSRAECEWSEVIPRPLAAGMFIFLCKHKNC